MFQASSDPQAPDVVVSYSKGPTGDDAADDRAAAAVVWSTLPYRFQRLGLVHRSSACLGPLCGTSSKGRTVSYAEMQAAFGARPPHLDDKQLSAEVHKTGMTALAVIGVIGLVVVSGAIVTVVILVRRRRAHPRTVSSHLGAPAGWYPDPQVPARLRYWDGWQWTAHLHPSA
jgi:hypothetical protein